MGVGRNHQVNALSLVPTEKYSPTLKTSSLGTLLSQQSYIKVFCLTVTCGYFHAIPQAAWQLKELMTQAECSCHLVLFFSERSVMGECLGVMCITITLLLHPTPLLILLAVARLNRLNPWTDWYIGACQRRCEELSLLLRCHCHYFIPPPLHSPFPTSYQGDRS